MLHPWKSHRCANVPWLVAGYLLDQCLVVDCSISIPGFFLHVCDQDVVVSEEKTVALFEDETAVGCCYHSSVFKIKRPE